MNRPGVHPPWYREPLVWLVLSFPLAAVVAGFWTLWLAVRSADGLVVDDYYRQGLQINRDLSRDARAKTLGLTLRAARVQDVLEVRLGASAGTALPTSVRVSLRHATRDALDRAMTVESGADGAYRMPVPGLPAGHWYLHVETPDWRLVDSLNVR